MNSKKKIWRISLLLLPAIFVCFLFNSCTLTSPYKRPLKEVKTRPSVRQETREQPQLPRVETRKIEEKKPPTEEERIAISIDQRAQEFIESGVVSKIQSQKIPSQRYNGVLVNEDKYKTYNILIFGPSPYFSNAYKYEVIPQTIVYVNLPPGFYHWRTFDDKKLTKRGTVHVGTAEKAFNERSEYLSKGYRQLDEKGNEYNSQYTSIHFQIGKFDSISKNKTSVAPAIPRVFIDLKADDYELGDRPVETGGIVPIAFVNVPSRYKKMFEGKKFFHSQIKDNEVRYVTVYANFPKNWVLEIGTGWHWNSRSTKTHFILFDADEKPYKVTIKGYNPVSVKLPTGEEGKTEGNIHTIKIVYKNNIIKIYIENNFAVSGVVSDFRQFKKISVAAWTSSSAFCAPKNIKGTTLED